MSASWYWSWGLGSMAGGGGPGDACGPRRKLAMRHDVMRIDFHGGGWVVTGLSGSWAWEAALHLSGCAVRRCRLSDYDPFHSRVHDPPATSSTPTRHRDAGSDNQKMSQLQPMPRIDGR